MTKKQAQTKQGVDCKYCDSTEKYMNGSCTTCAGLSLSDKIKLMNSERIAFSRAKDRAKQAGEKYFFSVTCGKCGEFKYITGSGACVQCEANEKKKREKESSNEYLLSININKHKSNPMYQKWG